MQIEGIPICVNLGFQLTNNIPDKDLSLIFPGKRDFDLTQHKPTHSRL